jgi:hypothetical protein
MFDKSDYGGPVAVITKKLEVDPRPLPKMTYRFLGRSGLQVSTLALGSWITFGGIVDQGQ